MIVCILLLFAINIVIIGVSIVRDIQYKLRLRKLKKNSTKYIEEMQDAKRRVNDFVEVNHVTFSVGEKQ